MKVNRRNFIKSMSGLALATVAGSFPAFSNQDASSILRDRKLRVAVFFDPDFPTIDFTSIPKETLAKAVEDMDVHFLGLEDIKLNLNTTDFDVFVTPYGSAFPSDGWNAISKYLSAGGNWVNIGGTPFSNPVYLMGKMWVTEIRQAEYYKKLGITQSFPVKKTDKLSFVANKEIESSTYLLNEFSTEEYFELYYRFSNSKDYPDEDGSTGPTEAILHPLVSALNKDKLCIAAPIVQIDRIKNDFAGGRWVLANFNGTITVKGIRSLVEIAGQGSLEFIVQPTFACYHEGEKPGFTAGLKRPLVNALSIVKGNCNISVTDEKNNAVGNANIKLSGDGNIAAGAADIILKNETLLPGFYKATCSVDVEVHPSQVKTLHYITGFWVFDKSLLSSGIPIEMNENYFLRDGKPYPVTGTTYMASDVHRKFFLEPNPAVWDKDFKQMKAAGINMVRTGIWSGWKNYMDVTGKPNESALRAMDAFVLTSRKYDIPLIFTFFAFIPESWGGVNAYLDPKSIEMQKKFITMFTSRYGMVNDIMWDIINEPSFCNPQHLWSTRPNYDAFEVAAWKEHLKLREADDRELFHVRSDEDITLPTLEDFDTVNILNDRHPAKVMEYRLFAQSRFAEWVKQMLIAIRSNGNSKQLITVGQDEGGTGDRPNPHFFRTMVSFTCIHNWWFNDDQVWDSVITKTQGRLNLAQETGVMFYEKMNSTAWRTEEEVSNLLERKLAISMGTGCAGFIEWIWNANPYMNSDNEAAIGLLRVDGSAKPELKPVMEYAKFFAANKEYMRKRKSEDVLMVIPHSQMFSSRNFATEATQQCIRTLYYRLHTTAESISEYRLREIPGIPKLMILPSPMVFSTDQWSLLLKKVEEGTTLLLTGPIDADEYWNPQQRLKELGISGKTVPVMNEEYLEINGIEYLLGYRGEKLQRIEKTVVVDSRVSKVIDIPHGKGTIIWSPLPVEVSDSPEAIEALYEYALKKSNVTPIFTTPKNEPSILILPNVYDDAVFYAFVSETDVAREVSINHRETNTTISVTVPAQKSVLLFIDRKNGKEMARLG